MNMSCSGLRRTLVTLVVAVHLLPALADAQVRPNQWNLLIDFQEVGRKDSAFDFPEEGFRIADSLGAALAFSRRTPRGQFSLFARGATVRFRDFRRFDGFNYSGAVSGARLLSPRTTFSFREAFSSGFDIGRLSSIGFSNPRLDAKTVNGVVGLTHRISPKTRSFVRFRHNWLSFVSLQSIEGSQFVPDTTSIENEEIGLPPDEPGVTPGGNPPPPPPPEGSFPVTPDGQDFALEVLSSEGLEVPRRSSLYGGLIVGISTTLSARTTASASANYGWREFLDSPGRSTGPAYGGRLGISRTFGRSDRIFANYNYRRNDAPDPSTTTQTLSGGWGRRLGTQFSIFLSSGVSYFQSTRGDDPGRTSLYVATGLSHFVKSTSLSVRYRRSVRQALGFGRSFLTDYVVANIGQRIGRRLSMAASAGYSLGQDLLEPESRPSSFRYGGSVAYRIIGGMSVGARYVVSENTRSRAGQESLRERRVWSFFVSYGHMWQ